VGTPTNAWDNDIGYVQEHVFVGIALDLDPWNETNSSCGESAEPRWKRHSNIRNTTYTFPSPCCRALPVVNVLLKFVRNHVERQEESERQKTLVTLTRVQQASW
jgi:hypothetical protein